jgi:hypothetical protein
MQKEKSLMILVAGPYRSGTNDDPQLIAANVKAMTARHWKFTELDICRSWGNGLPCL